MSEVSGKVADDWFELLREKRPEVHNAYREYGFAQAGLFLDATLEEDNFGVADYWRRFREEMRVILCTEEPKYAKVREEITRWTENASQAMAVVVAAAVGGTLGIDEGPLVPFVALVFGYAASVGVDVWCAHGCTEGVPA